MKDFYRGFFASGFFEQLPALYTLKESPYIPLPEKGGPTMRLWSAILGSLVLSTLLSAQEPYWKPYAFKGTEHFKYQITQKQEEETKTGEYVIDLSREGEQYRIRIQGRFGGNEGSFSTTVSSPSEIGGTLMGQMFFNPWVAPVTLTLFTPTLLMLPFGGLTMGSWEIGSHWKHKDESGNEVSVEIPSACEHAGKSGRKLVVKENGEVVYETCVAQGVALPLYVKFRNKDDGSLYEAKLVEYSE